MKKLLRITALVLLSLTLVLTLVSCGGGSAPNAEGECGSGLTWSYDSKSAVLSISGNGKMTDYSSSSEVPWISAKAYIKTITVSSGVEHIGSYAFYGASALETVNLPDSVASVGDYAFAYATALENAALPEALTALGDSAFEGCSALVAAFVPASVTELGKNVFAFCYSATDAAVLANIAVPEGTFYNCRSIEHLLLNTNITDDMVDEKALVGAGVELADADRTESETASATLTVKYIDSDGNEMFETVVKENISYGDSYSVVSPSKEGYSADKLTVSGNLYGKNLEVVVTYTKDAVVETAPVEDGEDKADEDKSVTPSTIFAIVILAVVLVAIGVFAVLFARSEKKNSAKNTTVRKNNTNDKKRR